MSELQKAIPYRFIPIFCVQNLHFAGLDLPRPVLGRGLGYEIALWQKVSPIQDIFIATSTAKKFQREVLQITPPVGWVYRVSSPPDLVINV